MNAQVDRFYISAILSLKKIVALSFTFKFDNQKSPSPYAKNCAHRKAEGELRFYRPKENASRVLKSHKVNTISAIFSSVFEFHSKLASRPVNNESKRIKA